MRDCGVAGWTGRRTCGLLIVDNIAMAHSRDSYEGEREIVVVPGSPVRLSQPTLADVRSG